MPSSRQRARKGSNSSCGRKSPNSSTNVSELLSPEPTKKDELIPTPSKKRRVDMNSSADEDDSSGSPLIGKRLWETFESNYKFLMEEDIIRTCRMTSELDLEYRKMLTGDQLCDEGGATAASTVSFTEFVQQYNELSQWLAKLDERRRPAASAARVEKYLDQGCAEELLQRTPRKNLLQQYATALLQRHPDIQEEVETRLSLLHDLWTTLERQSTTQVDENSLQQCLHDIQADLADLQTWYEELAHGLPNSNAWLQMMGGLSRREVKQRMTSLEAQQKEIEARSRAIAHVLKLMDRVEDLEGSVVDLLPSARALEENVHAAWLQSLELLYCTEQVLNNSHRRQSMPPPECQREDRGDIQASDPCNLASVIVGSWAHNSGLAEDTRDGSGGLSQSCDILPFSEDEYEKIVVPSSAWMRCKSRELMDDEDVRLHERALYSADLCYDTAADTSTLPGATLHRRSHRETVIRRQSASGLLPDDSSLFLSDTELFSSGWCAWDASVSRSAEVLLRPESESGLEVSQVHAVLSVTPKKAYYRMTALDHELNDTPSRGRPVVHEEDTETEKAVEVTEAERPRPALLDATLEQLAPIGEEEVGPLRASSPMSGMKRRYSRSACPDVSPVVVQQRFPEVEEKEEWIDNNNRSSSWRELITQLEHDVRHSGGVAGSADDDAGSLADESASSGGCDGPARPLSGSLSPITGSGTPTGRTHAGRIRRLRRRTSMQLAEQAELIVQSRSRDSLVSDPDDLPPVRGSVGQEDSLDQAWDHYQVPMYPSAYEDDEEEEKLDLCWDEQLEATMDSSHLSGRSQRPLRELSDTDGDTTIEDFIAHSSLMLERARYSKSLPPDQTLEASGDHLDLVEATDLEREVARQSEWLAACDTNLNCLDHLKETLTDSGVEDDLEPIRQQVETLLKQWTAFKEETLGRLKLIEGLHRIHDEADIIKEEAQRVADILDAPTDPQFYDCAQMDKFASTLQYYEASMPGWQIAVDEMHRTLVQSLEREQVEYLDVRKCHAENLHLLGQWLYSLHTRTASKLAHVSELRVSYDGLMSLFHEVGESLSGEEHLLRCTRLAVDIMNHSERVSALSDIASLDARLVTIDQRLADAEQHSSRLSKHFSTDHWQHVDSRMTALAARLIALKEGSAGLADTLAETRRPAVKSSPRPRRRGKVGRTENEAARKAVNTWRGRRLWRYLRASLPYQLALLVLFGCVYYLLADHHCDGRMGNLLFSPQLRQALGSPY